MATLLGALLRNESGGRNVTNTNATTTSGRARGYFQITDGTWLDFGGGKYAPTALQASPEQQWDIASRIPVKRWAPETVALMRRTGRPIDPDRTLGENLAMNGETFSRASLASPGSVVRAAVTDGPKGQEVYTPAEYAPGIPLSDYGDPAFYSPPPFDTTPGQNGSLADLISSHVGDKGLFSQGPLAPDQSQKGGTSPPPAFEFESAIPADAPPAAAKPSTPPGDAEGGSLADLFTIGDFGGAGTVDPATGLPKIPRQRRTYG